MANFTRKVLAGEGLDELRVLAAGSPFRSHCSKKDPAVNKRNIAEDANSGYFQKLQSTAEKTISTSYIG